MFKKKMCSIVVVVSVIIFGGLFIGFTNVFAFQKKHLPVGQIAYTSSGSLYTMNSDGSDKRTVVPARKKPLFISDPVWTSDGEKILFAFKDEKKFDKKIYGIGLVDSNEEKGKFEIILQSDSHSFGYPAFLPHVKKICFIKGGSSICLIDSSGANLQKIVELKEIVKLEKNEKGWIYSLSYLPTKKKLVFGVAIREEKINEGITTSTPKVGSIYIINLDGTNLQFLTHGRRPRSSPNSNKIAYIKEGSYKINTIDVDTKKIRTIYRSWPCWLNYLAWSPDGKYILYQKTIEWPTMLSSNYLRIISVKGRKKFKVANKYTAGFSWKY
ncbi:PD40 domain-containing protein [bacterium]|nr:PD40 domain-containing protein [bacterium]